LLVFYRGNWCPFCVSHLDDIQNLFPTLKNQGIQLLAISPDTVEDSQTLSGKFDQPYVFVTDQDLAIANAYGVQRDESIPHPTVVLINAAGNVVWFFAGESYRQRPSAKQLQQVIEQYL
ncbi:MAG: redoxin domain-containing protein, partial [Pseudomonadales bacterium]|nr:redoxin domain-containing protein [Pseudomonadales bacterium]